MYLVSSIRIFTVKLAARNYIVEEKRFLINEPNFYCPEMAGYSLDRVMKHSLIISELLIGNW